MGRCGIRNLGKHLSFALLKARGEIIIQIGKDGWNIPPRLPNHDHLGES